MRAARGESPYPNTFGDDYAAEYVIVPCTAIMIHG